MVQTDGKNVRTGRKLYLWYSFAFLIIGTVVFGQLFIFGKTLLWNADGFLQRYASCAKFYDTFHSLFSGGGFSFWNWDIGLGADFLSTFGFLVFDPFCYLMLLFPKENIDIVYTFIIILRLYVAGLAMIAYLRYHRKRNLFCLLGAVGYAFCAWGLVCTRQDFFITHMIIFPLLILGVDKVEDGRSPLTLIFSVFWSVINSIYFSYMSAMFVVMYILVRYFTSANKKSPVDFLVKILKYVLYAVTGGVLLAAPVLLPSLMALLQAGKGSGTDIPLLPDLVDIMKFVPAFAGTIDIQDNYAVCGMNMLFVLLIPAIFMQWKKKKASVWMFIICLPFLLFPGLQSLTNGLSYPAGRWAYVFCFFFVYAAIECLEGERFYERSYIKIILLTLALILGWSIVGSLCVNAFNASALAAVLINMLFAFLIAYVLYEMRTSRERRLRLLTITVMINTALIGFVFFNPMVSSFMNSLMSQGQCHKIYANNSLRAAEKIGDDELYRVDTVDVPTNTNMDMPHAHTPLNAPLYWGVSSSTVYLSTIDEKWLEFNRKLGNSAGYYRRTCSFSNDNRSRLDFLLGVKYFFGNDKKRPDNPHSQYAGYGFKRMKTGRGVSILKSPYEAGLGYVYDKAVSETQLMKYSPLEREQVLMQCAELSEDDIKQTEQTRQAQETEVELENMVSIPYELSASDGIRLKKNGFKANIGATLTIDLKEKAPAGEIYVLFRNLKKKTNPDMIWKANYLNKDRIDRGKFLLRQMSAPSYGNFTMVVKRENVSKRLINAEGEPQGIREISDYMANLGEVSGYSGKISCFFETMGDYSYDSLEVISVPLTNYPSQAEKLEARRLHVTSYTGDRVTGDVDAGQGGMLYLSIPYHEGWKISVDGKEAEKVFRVNTAFMGVELPAGEHRIELRYQLVGMPYTAILAVVGIVLLIMFGGISVYRERMRSKAAGGSMEKLDNTGENC